MLLCLQNVCAPEEVSQLRMLAAESDYGDGRKTAGWAAREVKHNEQVEAGPRIDTIRSLVRKALMRHPLFTSFAQPKSITRMLVSRYREGMEYGLHVDDALMGGRRADQREILFDLDQVCRSMFEASGKTPQLDLLLKTKSNLLRQWAED